MAIDSALAQDYPHTEIIVVDDGSTDDSANIAQSYGKRLIYLRKENAGVASALNLAIASMHGDFFSWLSHDDLYLPEKISHQMAFWREQSRFHSANLIVYSNVLYIDEIGQRLRRTTFPPHKEPLNIIPVFLGHINGCSLLIPRIALQQAGTFNESLRVVQDYDLWARMSHLGLRYILSPACHTISRIHSKQGSRTIDTAADECSEFYVKLLENLNHAQKAELEALTSCYVTLLRIRSERESYIRLTDHIRTLAPHPVAHAYYKYLDCHWDGRFSPVGSLLHPLHAIRSFVNKLTYKLQL